jgi:hypothetical protein
MEPAMTITGCWEGALRSDSGDAVPFSLHHTSASAAGPMVRINGGVAAASRVLDGAPRVLVTLVSGEHDRIPPHDAPTSDWLMEARRHGDRLIGRWLRRESDGRVSDRGSLEAQRV